jgi:hypothetical protein
VAFVLIVSSLKQLCPWCCSSLTLVSELQKHLHKDSNSWQFWGYGLCFFYVLFKTTLSMALIFCCASFPSYRDCPNWDLNSRQIFGVLTLPNVVKIFAFSSFSWWGEKTYARTHIHHLQHFNEFHLTVLFSNFYFLKMAAQLIWWHGVFENIRYIAFQHVSYVLHMRLQTKLSLPSGKRGSTSLPVWKTYFILKLTYSLQL